LGREKKLHIDILLWRVVRGFKEKRKGRPSRINTTIKTKRLKSSYVKKTGDTFRLLEHLLEWGFGEE